MDPNAIVAPKNQNAMFMTQWRGEQSVGTHLVFPRSLMELFTRLYDGVNIQATAICA